MQSTDQPEKIIVPFANEGNRRDIPIDSQIGIVDGRASFTDGFPPKTFIPVVAGGVPPAGSDFNGLFHQITDIQRWLCSGAMFTYDADFADAIGGYPKGSRIISTDGITVWINQADNNITDPDGGSSANWTSDKKSGTYSNLDFITSATERAAILAGTSTTDHTVLVQRAIDAAGTSNMEWLGTVNCRQLFSAKAVNWKGVGGAKVIQIPAVYTGPNACHIELSGPQPNVEGIEFNGNQFAMVSGQGTDGVRITQPSATLRYVKIRAYNGVGYTNSSTGMFARRTLHIGCNIDNNAGLGWLGLATSHMSFAHCSFNSNGYGFQKTRANSADTSHGYVAFGTALRFRSHHIDYFDCESNSNGRDGFNVNQGSYAIRYIGCRASDNDDGGFTVASDNTGTGLPGEGEPCSDIFFDGGCVACNNYGSGFVAYQSVNGFVCLGQSYNNHRLAGDLAPATSYPNGVYVAAGSTGVKIDVRTYDDRQSRSITQVSGNTISAAGWVPGTMNSYPKVAIYAGTDQSFKGYGKITEEANGLVTIQSTPYNGISMPSIVNGDYITQAVQHNGVFCDNNCQGIIGAQGAGHRVGAVTSVTGRLLTSAGFARGQNILLSNERQFSAELLVNPSFDTGIANWVFNIPGGGAANAYTGLPKRSIGGLQIIAGTSDAQGDGALSLGTIDAVQGEFVEASIWCTAFSRGDTALQVFWTISGSTFESTIDHPGGGPRVMKIGLMIPVGTTAVIFRIKVTAGKTAYFDEGSFKAVMMHQDPREFLFPTRSLPF